jgi:hypothetical protein
VGGLNSSHLFLIALKASKSTIKVLADLILNLLASWLANRVSLSLLTRQREEALRWLFFS